ncbi:MAG: glycosyltransferase family 2 protein [Kiritimatiellia bacterium]|nr:glycosyltransferase family 2 protein [Kiritimatiellia bacterium]
MKLISIITPCYNEEQNVRELYEKVKQVMAEMTAYRYEHIFIDNASTDQTVSVLRALAQGDKNLKIIVNARNFGHIRSPYYAILQAQGDAVISIVADLQDPPELIKEFILKWESGYGIVVGVKKESKESRLFYGLRQLYYRILARLSNVDLIEQFTGFGLYDRRVIDVLRNLKEPYPYFRGLIAEIGLPRATIEYIQPLRSRGITKNNFYTLLDIAMLGLTSHSKVPLRLAVILGFVSAIISLGVAFTYLIYKILFWNSFTVGLAPLVVGIFFFSSVQLLFLGIVGEYVGSIHTYVQNRPLVIEKERINF